MGTGKTLAERMKNIKLSSTVQAAGPGESVKKLPKKKKKLW